MMAERPMTLGERRVRISFNPSANATVEGLKRMAADFIDACERMRRPHGPPGSEDGEVNRLIALAQTDIEAAAMHAVKAATA
jgi:hypothetical protein